MYKGRVIDQLSTQAVELYAQGTVDLVVHEIEQMFDRKDFDALYERFQRELQELREQLEAPHKAYTKGQQDERNAEMYQRGKDAERRSSRRHPSDKTGDETGKLLEEGNLWWMP